MVGFEYEFSAQYLGRMLTLVSAPSGAPLWAVLECARQAHAEMYARVCRVVRLAERGERPPRWDVNPKPGLQGEIWMLVVVFDEVSGLEVDDAERE